MLRASLASLDEDQQRGILIFRDPEFFLFRPLEVTTGIGKALRCQETALLLIGTIWDNSKQFPAPCAPCELHFCFAQV